MAFAKGSQSSNATSEFKNYIGVAPVKVLCVNPSKKEMHDILGIDTENEPIYASSVDAGGAPQKNIRITFWVATDPNLCNGISLRSHVTFFLQDSKRSNRDNTKCQVIDKFGRTAWVTNEEFSSRAIPVYKNGQQANIDRDYRLAYIGEEALTKFLIAYLNIPSPANYIDGEWVMKESTIDSIARLDRISEYFGNNIQEIREALNWQPDNSIKVLFGLRDAGDGKYYPQVYSDLVLRSNAKNYTALEKEISNRKANGGLQNFIYEVCDLKEYTVAPTTFGATAGPSENQPAVDDLPW